MARLKADTAMLDTLRTQAAVWEAAVAEGVGRYEALQRSIDDARTRGDFSAQWRAVHAMMEGHVPLYRLGKHPSASAYVRAMLPGESLRTVQRNVRVALAFEADDIAARGVHVLEEISLYAAERDGTTDVAPLDLDALKVSVPDAKGVRRKVSARTVTVDQVRLARRQLRAGGAGGRKASGQEAIVRAALGDDPVLRAIGVRVRGERVVFGAVPLEALRAFGRAIGKAQTRLERRRPVR